MGPHHSRSCCPRYCCWRNHRHCLLLLPWQEGWTWWSVCLSLSTISADYFPNFLFVIQKSVSIPAHVQDLPNNFLRSEHLLFEFFYVNHWTISLLTDVILCLVQ